MCLLQEACRARLAPAWCTRRQSARKAAELRAARPGLRSQPPNSAVDCCEIAPGADEVWRKGRDRGPGQVLGRFQESFKSASKDLPATTAHSDQRQRGGDGCGPRCPVAWLLAGGGCHGHKSTSRHGHCGNGRLGSESGVAPGQAESHPRDGSESRPGRRRAIGLRN